MGVVTTNEAYAQIEEWVRTGLVETIATFPIGFTRQLKVSPHPGGSTIRRRVSKGVGAPTMQFITTPSPKVTFSPISNEIETSATLDGCIFQNQAFVTWESKIQNHGPGKVFDQLETRVKDIGIGAVQSIERMLLQQKGALATGYGGSANVEGLGDKLEMAVTPTGTTIQGIVNTGTVTDPAGGTLSYWHGMVQDAVNKAGWQSNWPAIFRAMTQEHEKRGGGTRIKRLNACPADGLWAVMSQDSFESVISSIDATKLMTVAPDAGVINYRIGGRELEINGVKVWWSPLIPTGAFGGVTGRVYFYNPAWIELYALCGQGTRLFSVEVGDIDARTGQEQGSYGYLLGAMQSFIEQPGTLGGVINTELV